MLAVLACIAGCVTYTGGARPVDPARVTARDGWIVAAATPALHQPGPLDCGAAAFAMVAARWHVALSVDDAVAALPSAKPSGVRLGDLRAAARKRGLVAYAIAGDRETLVHELAAGRPVIVGLVLPISRDRGLSHYEVVVAVNPAKDQFATIDPSTGWRARSWADLDAEWRPAGHPTLVVLGLADEPPAPTGPLSAR